MSGTTSFLFQGQPVPPQPTGQDTSTSYPLWLQQYVYNLANAATNLAGQPYTPYPGQQVATPSATTTSAWDLAKSNVGNYQPALTGALGYTTEAGQPVTGEDISRYMNPYTDKVVGAITDNANRNFFNTTLPQIQDRFVSSGQSRSPQEMKATSDAVHNYQDALSGQVANAEMTGYQGALNTALQGKQQMQTAGAQLGQLGALTGQLGAADVGTLAASGQAQDQVSQANLNAALNNFYSQQNWPYQNLGYASNIIRGLPINTNQQTVGQAYNPYGGYTASPLSSFLGTAYGASAMGVRKGGHIKRWQPRDRRAA